MEEAYRSLVVDLRAAVDGQCVRIGIKDRHQPDNGSEISVQRCLTTQWSTMTLPLNAFTGVDLAHLYVVFEVLLRDYRVHTLLCFCTKIHQLSIHHITV
jgi:hypothetical protein